LCVNPDGISLSSRAERDDEKMDLHIFEDVVAAEPDA
jgi:hypothetical protein